MLPDDNEDKVKGVANHLLETYCDHTDEAGNTSRTGLMYMEGVMDNVPGEYRADVFTAFLTLLDMNEIEYDPLLFQSSPSKAVH